MVDSIDGRQMANFERRLELLNGFRLDWDTVEQKVPPHSAILLAFLALRNRPVDRSVVAGTFWPAFSEHRAKAALRSALYRISVPVVSITGSALRLVPELRVDFRDAWSVAHEVVHSALAPPDIAPVVDVLSQELLPDSDALWLEPERHRYRQLRLRALDALERRLYEAERYTEAVEVAQIAVVIEPTSEKAEYALINALIAEGNESLAVREYREFRRRLWRDLRVRPVLELDQLLTTARDPRAVGKIGQPRPVSTGSDAHSRR
jgi:DNA-binding SARP family transcriptional activator